MIAQTKTVGDIEVTALRAAGSICSLSLWERGGVRVKGRSIVL
jgi:hypothetical protein